MGLRESIKRILRESLDLDYSEGTMKIIEKMMTKMDLPFVESFKVVWSEMHGAYEIKLYYPKHVKQNIRWENEMKITSTIRPFLDLPFYSVIVRSFYSEKPNEFVGGINENYTFPITETHPLRKEFEEFKSNFKTTNDVDFVIFWNNRNIRRKQPGDLILAYNEFCNTLPKEKAKRCVLLMHTQPIDDNGTDLIAVKNAVCPEYKIIFSDRPVDNKMMNFFYNLADVTVNIASNEGFGLSGAESLMAGTPIINNVTGGLQDHCRFEDENGDWIEFTTEFPTNHTGRYKKHGVWCKPVVPTNRSLQGSPQTPYIFDDRVDFKDVANALMYWYEMPEDTRVEYGLEGHKWVSGNESNMSARRMGDRFIECINTCLNNWTPRKRFTLYKVEPVNKLENVGVL